MDTKRLSLNLYSFGYYGGFISDPKRNREPLGIEQLVKLALQHQLGGVELPFDHFYSLDRIEEGVDRLEMIRDQGLRVFIDLEKTSVPYIKTLLPHLSRLNMSVIRIKMDQIGKTFYGGNRYAADSFAESAGRFRDQLSELLPDLERYGVSVAIENHQDYHSSELAELAAGLSEELIGITWDIGNSASVIDSPESFWSTAGHLVKNVHLKDYHIHRSERGIRMVRCPLGDGYVDFPSVLNSLLVAYPEINMSIELGAQITRECDINMEDYWAPYGDVDIDREAYLGFLDEIAEPVDTDNGSVYEQGCNEDAMIDSELQEVQRSVNNLQQIQVV